MIYLRLFIILFMALSVSSCSESTDPYTAYDNRNYESARENLLPLVGKNDLKAITFLAAVCQIERNYDEAIKLYTKAARQNYASAQYNLGILLREGRGIERNVIQAYGWFHLASEQDHSKAKEQLFSMVSELSANQTIKAKAWAKDQLVEKN